MPEPAETYDEIFKHLDFAEFSQESPYGFSGFVLIGELMDKNCEQVPSVPGIYIVSVPKGFEHKFLPESPVLPRRQVARFKSVNCLEKKWVEGTTVIYIGKSGGDHKKATLRHRLRAYMRSGSGKNARHYGGEYIWQLERIRSCPVAWMPLLEGDPEKAEGDLIDRFTEQYDNRLPFANRKKRRFCFGHAS
ncbi:MAG: hypothetical protein LBG29_10045 [Synergistaceae bacterium]|jgi:hypothetical protein|nr:hypothetical protein [Synergistaceae bacterium]